MKIRRFQVVWPMTLLAAASLALARGAEPVEKPAVPDASLSATLTNLSRSAPKKDGLKQLEEELSRSLQPFSPRDSLDSILTPRYIPPPAVVPNRRPRNDAEKSSGWLLNGPSDLTRTSQDPFKTLEGSAKPGGWDDLLRGWDRPRQDSAPGTTKSDLSKRQSSSFLDDLDDEDLQLPSGLRESAKSLRDSLIGNDSIFSRDSRESGVSSLFAPEETGLSREQIEAHQEYVERFRQTLNILPPSAAERRDSLTPRLGSELPSSSSKPVYTPPNLLNQSAQRNTFAATPAGAQSFLRPASVPDPNERTLNQWNPLYVRPQPAELPRPVPFASPALEIPRRKF